jgi:hypothetical protein
MPLGTFLSSISVVLSAGEFLCSVVVLWTSVAAVVSGIGSFGPE